MPTTYTLVSDPSDKFEVVGDQLRLKNVLLNGTSATALVRENRDGVITDYTFNVDKVNAVREITKRRNGATHTIPQSFYDKMAIDAADANTHPHLGTATHVAIKNGNWSDPTTWFANTPPTEFAAVNYAGYDINYDVESNLRISTIHVGGAGIARWATNVDTKLVVDTIICHGALIMGEPGNPITESPTAGKPRCEIIFAQVQSPLTTVRFGLMTMGPVRIQAAEKTYQLFSNATIPANATSVTLDGVATSNWRVGDVILFPGTEDGGTTATDPEYLGPTQFYGPYGNNPGVIGRGFGYRVSTDEERVITSIVGNVVSWTQPLVRAHTLHSEVLERGQTVTIKPRVANKSRSIRLRTAGGKAGDTAIWSAADLTVLQKRAHFMSMFSYDVQIRGLEVLDMGRTDTNPSMLSPLARMDFGALIPNMIAYDKPPEDGTRVAITDVNNVRGRYPIHIHGTGVFLGQEMVVVEDCVVHTSPGAPPTPGNAIVHHNSTASIRNCIVHNVRGSGMTSELGNERGQWIGNLVCYVRGDGYVPAFGSRAEWWQNHNGHYGAAYENQARQILMQDNHASSAHKAYAYMQQTTAAELREPDAQSLRVIDPVSKGYGNWQELNGEQPQIMDFKDNTAANCSEGFYVEHRLNDIDRPDETPMVMSGFHCVNVGTPFNMANYAQHYHVFDSLWTNCGSNPINIGPVSWSMMFVNVVIKNSPNGFTTGYNYGGFTVDCKCVNVPGFHFVDTVTAFGVANEDPTQHPHYNAMDAWVITDNNNPSPGFTARIRTGRNINSQTDIPQIYPTPPLSRYMPNGSPAVPFGSDPYFLLDTAQSQLTLNRALGSNLIIAGTLRDSLGDRRFGDYQNPETFPQNFGVKLGRHNQQTGAHASPDQIVARNYCYLDGATWKSRLWFIYTDRIVKNKYYFPFVDITLVGFPEEFLLANQVSGPEVTKPKLPLVPELEKKTRYVPSTVAPLITSKTTIAHSSGLPLAHVIRMNDGQAKVALQPGGDAADMEIITAAGVNTLRFVGNSTIPTARSLNFTIRVTNQFGIFTDVPYAVNVGSIFVDTFAGPAGQFLDARQGWTRLSGSEGGFRLDSSGTVLERYNTSEYRSPNFGSADSGIKVRFLSSNSSGRVIIRAHSDGSYVAVGRNGNAVNVDVHTTGGAYLNGAYGGDFTQAQIDGIITIEAIGNTVTVKSGNDVLRTATVSGSLLTGTGQGLKLDAFVQGGYLGYYESYAILPVTTLTTFEDNFDGIDENLEDRAGWTRVGGVAGAAAVRNNQLATLSTTTTIYLAPDPGSANQRITYTPSQSTEGQIVMRYVDENNWVGVGFHWSSQMFLYVCVNGTITQPGSWGNGGLGNLNEFELIGDKITYKQNGVSVPISGDNTIPVFATGTKAGLRVASFVRDPWINYFKSQPI